MRLATALDEVQPLQDARVPQPGLYRHSAPESRRDAARADQPGAAGSRRGPVLGGLCVPAGPVHAPKRAGRHTGRNAVSGVWSAVRGRRRGRCATGHSESDAQSTDARWRERAIRSGVARRQVWTCSRLANKVYRLAVADARLGELAVIRALISAATWGGLRPWHDYGRRSIVSRRRMAEAASRPPAAPRTGRAASMSRWAMQARRSRRCSPR